MKTSEPNMTQTSDDTSSSCNKGETGTGATTAVIMDHENEKGNSNSSGGSVALPATDNDNIDSFSQKVSADLEAEAGPSTSGNKDVQNETDTPLKCDVTKAPTSGSTTAVDTSLPLNLTTVSGGEMERNREPVVLELNATSFSFSKVPRCPICSEPCICYCKSCKKASYCSKEHQKKHWKKHRPECYPVMVQVNSVFGSHLVVTRDIKRGEVILREKPLVSVPFLNNNPDSTALLRNDPETGKTSMMKTSESECSLCLSCRNVLWSEEGSFSACSKCGWPVCSMECETNPTHADQECKLFAEYHVQPSALCDKDAQYLCVALLRILLQRKLQNGHDNGDDDTAAATESSSDATSSTSSLSATTGSASSKWFQFMDVVNKQVSMKDGLNSQLAEAKKATAHITDLISKSLGSIIYREFSVTLAEIDQIVRTLRTSSFITDAGGNYINGFGFSSSVNNNSDLGHHCCSRVSGKDPRNTPPRYEKSKDVGKVLSVYHLASMLISNCVPNASWIIHGSLDFYLRANVPIKTGETVTVTFVDPTLATWERRETLWREKYLLCTCSRCCNMTENFFAAIKCADKKCEGYLVPTDPLAVTYTTTTTSTTTSNSTEETEQPDKKNSLPQQAKLCEERLAEWKCNVCLMRQPWDFVRASQHHLWCTTNGLHNDLRVPETETGEKVEVEQQQQLKDDEGIRKHDASAMDLGNLEARVNKIDVLVGNIAHPNHYYVLKMENEVLTGISKLLEMGQVPLEQMEKWALRMIEMCKKGLRVFNALCPGLNRERGRLLYFLQQALAISLLFNTSRAMRARITKPKEATVDQRDGDSSSSGIISNYSQGKEVATHEELVKKFNEVILARKEVLEIFALADEHSAEGEMLRAVQRDSIEMRLLKNHFQFHQNVNGHR